MIKTTHKNIDWLLILLSVALIAIGWINIYSTTANDFTSFNFQANYGKQLIWIGSAIILALFT